MREKTARVMWKLNLYKLTFGVVLFCYLSNEILGGVITVPSEEVSTESSSSGRSKSSQSKRLTSSHHHHHQNKIELNVTQPTDVIIHQYVSKTASPGLASSELTTTAFSSASDESGSFKSDDHFSGMDAFAVSGSSTQQETSSSTETPKSVEPDSVSSKTESSKTSSSDPSTSSPNSPNASSTSKPTSLISQLSSFISWIYSLISKLFT